MNYQNMPLEELVNRWEDRRELQNLMGRYTYDLLLKKEEDIFDTYWCQNAEPTLGFNGGFYTGREAVAGYYEACHRKNLLRTSLIVIDFADKAAERGLDEEKLYGAGVLDHKPLGNQIIEIAGDRKTAKGFWYVVGKEDEYGRSGPLSCWTFGMFGVDFIMEDGQWRIWHLTYAEDIHTPCGESWASEPKARPENPAYTAMADFKMPEFTDAKQLHSLYTPNRPFSKTLPLPEPYGTFAETFSYGA